MSGLVVQELLREDLVVKTALLSVSDRTGLVELARFLVGQGVELVASGGTRDALMAAKVPVAPLTDIARFPEILGGRVKTIQVEIAGGMLANTANPEHMQHLKQYNIRPIGMAVCNLYPFEAVAAKDGSSGAELTENVDIGGVNILRAGAKNHDCVCVVPGPSNYQFLMNAMKANGGRVPYVTRMELAIVAWNIVARYDAAVASALPDRLRREYNSAPRKSRSV